MCRGLQDGLERALDFHARYLGLDEGGSVIVNRDFENMTMRPEMLTAYVGAVANAGLPPRILLEAMQQGGLIGPDEDLDVLEVEMSANAQAAMDAKANTAQDQLTVANGGKKAVAPNMNGAMPTDGTTQGDGQMAA